MHLLYTFSRMIFLCIFFKIFLLVNVADFMEMESCIAGVLSLLYSRDVMFFDVFVILLYRFVLLSNSAGSVCPL